VGERRTSFGVNRMKEFLKASEENVKFLRNLFGLPEIEGEVKKDILAEMNGMWKELSEEGTDSVELVRQIRYDECDVH